MAHDPNDLQKPATLGELLELLESVKFTVRTENWMTRQQLENIECKLDALMEDGSAELKAKAQQLLRKAKEVRKSVDDAAEAGR